MEQITVLLVVVEVLQGARFLLHQAALLLLEWVLQVSPHLLVGLEVV